MSHLLDEFSYDNYFDDSFTLNDFITNVELWLEQTPSEQAEEPVEPTSKKRKTPSVQAKKPKKNYTMQLMELKQEIKDLRQEIEVRDAQILALIRGKT